DDAVDVLPADIGARSRVGQGAGLARVPDAAAPLRKCPVEQGGRCGAGARLLPRRSGGLPGGLLPAGRGCAAGRRASARLRATALDAHVAPPSSSAWRT